LPEKKKKKKKKRASLIKQSDLRDMFRKASRSAHISVTVVSSDPFSSTPSASSAMQTPENTEEEPDDPKPAN
jgi:hypothetical protein